MEYNKEWEYGTPVDCDCENNFIHIDCGCKPKDVCECENILLEISKLKTQGTVLQREIDEISGASISGVTEEEVDEKIASAKTEIEAEIPSLSGYATQEWVEDKHYITGVDLSNYATLEDIPTVPTNVSAFINDVSYVTTSELLQYISNLQQQINSLVSSISGCCGSSGETQYRWITMTGENDYWCSGTTKMSEEKEQSSTDGLTWIDTGNIRSGNTVLETDCEDCGYVPPEEEGYLSYVAFSGNHKAYTICGQNNNEILSISLGGNKGALVHTNMETAVIGDCCVRIGHRYSDYIDNVRYGSAPNLQSITCYATTPPEILISGSSYQTFDNTNNCPIYVPAASLNAYKTAPGWSKYADRIQAIV